MKIINKIVYKITNNPNIQLDRRIPKWHIARLCFIYGKMLVRGWFSSLFRKNFGRGFMKGSHVRLWNTKFLNLGRNVRLQNYVFIDALSTDGVILGDRVKIGSYSEIIASGSITSVGKGLMIGANSSFGEYCFFGAAGGILIGENNAFGQNVRFHSENHNYRNLDIPICEQGVSHKGIVIGDDCWIGAGAVFLDGAHVGNGCVVAANAVVRGNYPDYVIIAGVPSKIIGKREHLQSDISAEKDSASKKQHINK